MLTLQAILSALPKAIALFQLLAGMVRDAEQRGLGRKEAIAEALTIAHRDIAWANAEAEQAVRDHAAHPDSDDGFDKTFMRRG